MSDSQTENCVCVFEEFDGISCIGRNELGTEYGHTVESANERCLIQPTCVSWETDGNSYWFSESCLPENAEFRSIETLYVKTAQGNAACVLENGVCSLRKHTLSIIFSDQT